MAATECAVPEPEDASQLHVASNLPIHQTHTKADTPGNSAVAPLHGLSQLCAFRRGYDICSSDRHLQTKPEGELFEVLTCMLTMFCSARRNTHRFQQAKSWIQNGV